MPVTSRKEAQEEVSRLVQIARDSLSQAEKISDEFYVDFSFNPAYGMGGHYQPRLTETSKWSKDDAFVDDWTYSDSHDADEYQGWRSSSQSC